MAAATISEGCSQLLGPGRILQKIHSQFQFEGQALTDLTKDGLRWQWTSLVSVGAILEQDFGQGLQLVAFESVESLIPQRYAIQRVRESSWVQSG